MTTRVRKWGNSLALRIPKALAESASLTQGTEVALSAAEGRLTVEVVRPEKVSLAELLAGITPENVHAEVDTGAPVGREEW